MTLLFWRSYQCRRLFNQTLLSLPLKEERKMSKKKQVRLSRLTVGFSLLIMVSALFSLVALPAQNARACDGGEQQVGFMLQGPITSTTCPTINILGLSINTTDAIFGYEGY